MTMPYTHLNCCISCNKLYILHCVIGGYKGYGLAMMVEVLCGILSGAKFGPNLRTWKDFEKVANLVSRGRILLLIFVFILSTTSLLLLMKL
jgi:LDH2 family malate/lactate/ureidoglycolate dehydrogenase